MKKYITFVVSFLLAYTLLQILSGMLLTFTYTPDIAEAWNQSGMLAQETIISSGQPSILLSLIISLFAASVAYFIVNKFKKINP
ncbi:hypothetical protein NSQ77_12735 [Oceanobacillus sp. FSL K6-2867]|uniref:hypothetical protein n=1 Tax=Oceanobacillus sp. FSL K6-2867 TaxID=2954748 RepID=UPI0030DA22B4